jgi:hypothetical protein
MSTADLLVQWHVQLRQRRSQGTTGAAGDVMMCFFFHADFHIAKIWKSNCDKLFFFNMFIWITCDKLIVA